MTWLWTVLSQGMSPMDWFFVGLLLLPTLILIGMLGWQYVRPWVAVRIKRRRGPKSAVGNYEIGQFVLALDPDKKDGRLYKAEVVGLDWDRNTVTVQWVSHGPRRNKLETSARRAEIQLKDMMPFLTVAPKKAASR